MKIYVVVHRSELHDNGDSAEAVGAFVNIDDAKASLMALYYAARPKDEYLESWNNPDDEDEDGSSASFCDIDDDFHEWHIDELTI